jgi:hypothetical protein
MWLRGHHLLGSVEAKAAQAAYALIVSAPATQSPGSAVTASMYPNPMTSYVGSMVSGGVPFIGGFSTGTKR